MKWMHSLEMEVRDYELDIQGIVNNAVYQNYLEHGRHKFIQEMGVNFAKLHLQGIDPVVVRAEIDYKVSLTSTDRFIIRSHAESKGKLRFVFTQEIIRLSDQALCVHSVITAATLVNGRPGPCPEMHQAIELFAAAANHAP